MRNAWPLAAVLLLAQPAGVNQVLAGAPSMQSASVELDTLFAKLRDPAVGNDAIRIEQQIWQLWLHAGSDKDNKTLALAILAINIGDFKRADTMLTELVKAAPDFAEAWNKRATLYFMMGRYDDSLADIKKVLDLEPRHFGALGGRGMIYQRLGRETDALAAFKDVLTVNPNSPSARQAVQLLEKDLPDL